MNRKISIDRIRIQGFRSLANVDVKLPRVAVLIGPNGSGKSNFVRFFELMHCMATRSLGEFVARQGGADDQLFGGTKRTTEINATVCVGTGETPIEYEFTLRHAHPDDLIVTKELFRKRGRHSGIPLEYPARVFPSYEREPKVGDFQHAKRVGDRYAMGIDLSTLFLETNVFQFHDTSDSSRFKQRWDNEDRYRLREDGGNIASILLELQRHFPHIYGRICHYIGRILPTFDRFQIEQLYGKVTLRWKQKGTDKTIGAHLTSDGSLRFFALVTLLHLPKEMLPRVLVIDEPELGLHPVAMEFISNMIKRVSDDCQVILATQSPSLIDHFGLKSTIVFDILDGRTEMRTLTEQDYQAWLKEYSPSTLWQKNLLGGRP